MPKILGKHAMLEKINRATAYFCCFMADICRNRDNARENPHVPQGSFNL